jgi:hypothetical protein
MRDQPCQGYRQNHAGQHSEIEGKRTVWHTILEAGKSNR